MSDGTIVRVRDVMNTRYILIDGLMTVHDALELLADREPCPFIVRKRTPDDEYGMLLLGDVARKVLARNRPFDRVNVYEVMAKPLIHLNPLMDIRYCARLFDSFDLSHAPVLEHNELLGIVSLPDLVLKGFARTRDA